MTFLFLLGLLATSIHSVSAQTWTSCNPLNVTCPPDPALGTNATFNFTSSLDDKIWNITNGAIDYTSQGAEFSIAKRLQSPTVQSNFYIFGGIVESIVQAAPGRGIVSSVVLQSDDLDEIDWEWVGYDTTHVQSNYYSKGVATYGRAEFHEVNGSAMTGFHNYTTYWTHEKLEWWIDGQLQRTLTYDNATNGTTFPQTPMNIRLGIWPAGDPKNPIGTIEWAGGEVDYEAGPYNMYVQRVRVHDFSTGKEYKYTDHSGTWESIETVQGNSTIEEEINKPPAESVSQKWSKLPSGAKIGIACAIAGVGASALGLFAFYCVKQRRAGRAEYNLENSKFDTNRTEMSNFQSQWRQSGYQPVHN
ncbi:CAZyme family GH16 [Paecilomyces variotii]|nr:CAZyme family GH16 [Paecilomyces variotii]